MVYIAIYVLAALATFQFSNAPKTARLFYPPLLVLFFILTAFRFEVGCDWTGYLVQFNYGKVFEPGDQTWWSQDPLWWTLIGWVRDSGLAYPWLNVVSAVIFFAGMHMLARRQPDRFAFLVLLWPILIINIAMSGIRQATATGILFIAFNAFVERRLVRFALLVVLAATIHSSAMVFLLLCPLVNGRYSRARIALAALLAVPGAMLMIHSAAGEVAVGRYVDTGADAAGAAFRVGLLALTGLVFFVSLRRPWLKSNAPDYKLMSIGSLGMIGLAGLLPLSTVIADRLGYYLVPIQAVMLARIPFLPIGRFKTAYMLAAYAALGLTLAVWVSFSDLYAKCYSPYRTWLVGTPVSRFTGI